MADTVKIRGVEVAKKHFSYSQVQKYLICPLKYWWHYVMGEKEPANGNLVLGGAKALTSEYDYGVKIATGKNENLSVKLDYFNGALKDKLKGENVVLEAGEDFNSLSKLGLELVAAHHTERAVKCNPIAVEKGLVTHIPGVKDPFILFIDLIEAVENPQCSVCKTVWSAAEPACPECGGALGKERVIDEKTSKNRYALHDAAVGPQLSLGSLATGILDVGYDVLVKSSKVFQPVYDRLTEEVRAYNLERMARVAQAIDAEVFIPPTPGEWPCNPSCHYWKKCAGKHIPVSVFAATESEKAARKAAQEAKKAAEEAAKVAKKAARKTSAPAATGTSTEPPEAAAGTSGG